MCNASDHLVGVSNRLPQGKALPASSQDAKRRVRKVKGGEWRENNIIKDVVSASDIKINELADLRVATC